MALILPDKHKQRLADLSARPSELSSSASSCSASSSDMVNIAHDSDSEVTTYATFKSQILNDTDVLTAEFSDDPDDDPNFDYINPPKFDPLKKYDFKQHCNFNDPDKMTNQQIKYVLAYNKDKLDYLTKSNPGKKYKASDHLEEFFNRIESILENRKQKVPIKPHFGFKPRPFNPDASNSAKNIPDEFKPVPKRHSARPKSPEQKLDALPTGNSFQPIAEEPADSSEETADNSAPTERILPPIPPIMLKTDDKFNLHIVEIKKRTKNNDLDCKTVRDFIKIQPKTDLEAITISEYLTAEKANFHLINRTKLRPIKVCLKGLPRQTPVDDIAEELRALGFKIDKVAQLKNFRTRTPYPIFQITISDKKQASDLYKLELFMHMRITVEEYRRPNQPMQCYNCQSFFHHSDNCKAQPSCVKCAGQHHTKSCTKLPETIPKCVNCGGDHTASSRTCPNRPKINISGKFDPLNHISYAKITSQNQPKHSQTTENPENGHNFVNILQKFTDSFSKSLAEQNALILQMSKQFTEALTNIMKLIAKIAPKE